MPRLTFDIATKVVPSSQNIWAMFPGIGKRFLAEFLASGVIFLETPAIGLTNNVLNDEELLRKHVAMSRQWAAYYRGNLKNPPSRRANTYSPVRDASFNAAVGNVRAVFLRMQPGDLVLVAGRSFYEPVHIGEIIGPFRSELTVQVRWYGDEVIPARAVRWIHDSPARRFLSERLSQLLSNKRTVVAVDKVEFGDEVYKITYGDYVFGDNSRYKFEGRKYNNIATSTVPGIELISYFCAAFNACDIDELEAFAQLSIRDAIDKYFEQDVLNSFEIDFKSPGSYILDARRAALPLLVAVLVAATTGDITFADAKVATIENSAVGPRAHASASNPVDPCPIEVQQKYAAIMESLQLGRFEQLCELNRAAQDGVGLQTHVRKKQGASRSN